MKGLFLLCALLICAGASAQDVFKVTSGGVTVFSAAMYHSMCVRDDGHEPQKCFVRRLSNSDKRWLEVFVSEDFRPTPDDGPKVIAIGDHVRIYLFTYWLSELGKESQISGVAYWRDRDELRVCGWTQETRGFAKARNEPHKPTHGPCEELPADEVLRRVD